MSPKNIGTSVSVLSAMCLNDTGVSSNADALNQAVPSLGNDLMNRILRSSASRTLADQKQLIRSGLISVNMRENNRALVAAANPLLSNKALSILCVRLDQQDETITEVDCSGYLFNGIELKSLVRSLCNHASSTALNLNACHLGDHAVADLLSTFTKEHKAIHQLKLRTNSIAKQSIAALRNFLGATPGLTHLDLSYNNFEDQGFDRLREVVVLHPNLKRVQLTYCGLSAHALNEIRLWRHSNPERQGLFEV